MGVVTYSGRGNKQGGTVIRGGGRGNTVGVVKKGVITGGGRGNKRGVATDDGQQWRLLPTHASRSPQCTATSSSLLSLIKLLLIHLSFRYSSASNESTGRPEDVSNPEAFSVLSQREEYSHLLLHKMPSLLFFIQFQRGWCVKRWETQLSLQHKGGTTGKKGSHDS